MQTREIELIPIDINFRTGELLTISTTLTLENLIKDFNLPGRIIIPAGQYDFRVNSLSVTSAYQKNLRGMVTYEWGEFFSGTKRSFNIASGWHAFKHLYIGDEMENSFMKFKLKYNIRI